MNVTLNSELLEEMEYFKYLGSKIIVSGLIDMEVKSKIIDVEDENECKEKVI